MLKRYRYVTAFILLVLIFPLGAKETATASVTCQVYFSPKDHLSEKLVSLIEEEQTSIHAAIYCLTHRAISKALMEAKKRGVKVEIIIDRFSTRVKSPVGKMEEAGIAVFVFDPVERGRDRFPLMHNKFVVFGSGKVWTGSFNFTRAADLWNEENAIVLEDPELAKLYKKHFLAIKRKGVVSYSEFLAGKGNDYK